MRNTREIVLKARKEFPEKTYCELGNIAGVTKQRVQQILKSEGIYFIRYVYECNECKKVLRSKNKTGMCGACFNKVRGFGYVDLVCIACKISFKRKAAIAYRNGMNKHLFCSRGCMGRILGLYFGYNSRKNYLTFDDAIKHYNEL